MSANQINAQSQTYVVAAGGADVTAQIQFPAKGGLLIEGANYTIRLKANGVVTNVFSTNSTIQNALDNNEAFPADFENNQTGSSVLWNIPPHLAGKDVRLELKAVLTQYRVMIVPY